ncbi:hypothetical protein [Sphingomonas sp. AX6]|uniref:hypothetical protein n=1 Tax=Sphingomonas sp. AX6 TaxID=2653171 RepID=UPI00135C47AA|nr:hypothetical protein [Sphingomonas sp. AX6]
MTICIAYSGVAHWGIIPNYHISYLASLLVALPTAYFAYARQRRLGTNLIDSHIIIACSMLWVLGFAELPSIWNAIAIAAIAISLASSIIALIAQRFPRSVR